MHQPNVAERCLIAGMRRAGANLNAALNLAHRTLDAGWSARLADAARHLGVLTSVAHASEEASDMLAFAEALDPRRAVAWHPVMLVGATPTEQFRQALYNAEQALAVTQLALERIQSEQDAADLMRLYGEYIGDATPARYRTALAAIRAAF